MPCSIIFLPSTGRSSSAIRCPGSVRRNACRPLRVSRILTGSPLLFSGDVKLPHRSVRVLFPSRQGVSLPATVELMKSEPGSWSVRISRHGNGRHPTDYLCWFPGDLPAVYRAPEPERGYWIRTRDGIPEEIIFMNTDRLVFDEDGVSVLVRWSGPVEGFARRDGGQWNVLLDSSLQGSYQMTEFVSGGRGGTAIPFAAAAGDTAFIPGVAKTVRALP